MNKKQFILEAPIMKVILTISIPLMVSNLIQTFYDLANALWLAKLGETPFAATTFVNPVSMLFVAIGMGIYVAGAALLSQLIGQGKLEEAQNKATHLFMMTLVLGFVVMIIGYLMTPALIRLMGAKGDLLTYSIDYLQVSFLGFPFIALYFAFQAILGSQGYTRQLMVANGLSLILNIIIVPFFIFSEFELLGIRFPGLSLGIRGAALATVIAKGVLLILGYVMVQRNSEVKPRFSFKLEKKSIKEILAIAAPAITGQSGQSAGFIILHAFIASYGVSTMAAFGLVNRITNLVMMPAMGVGASLTSIVGQNLGAAQIPRIYEAFIKANVLNLVMTLVGVFFFFIFDYEIITAFLSEEGSPETIAKSLNYLYFLLPTIPLMGMFSIFQGVFQGSGFTIYSMYMEIGRLWLVRLPLILIFRSFTDFGSTGIWFAMSFSNLVTILFGYALYSRRRWVQGRI